MSIDELTQQQILDSPAGRRAVEAMCGDCGGEGRKGRLAAALRELLSDTCPTCGGRKEVPNPGASAFDSRQPCPNPDCKNGKVTPALIDPNAYREWMLNEFIGSLASGFGWPAGSDEAKLMQGMARRIIERRESE